MVLRNFNNSGDLWMNISFSPVSFTAIKGQAFLTKDDKRGIPINIPDGGKLTLIQDNGKVRLSTDPYKAYASVLIHKVDNGSQLDVKDLDAEKTEKAISQSLTATQQNIINQVDSLKDDLIAINDNIHEFAEVGLKEFKSSQLLINTLLANNFDVKTNSAGLETAFEATFKNGIGGPTIGILAEYDALEGLGHGCGHNCIAASAIGAALALKKSLGNIPATIKVFGTPAEETTGGKINMVEAGLMDSCDVILMSHPSDTTTTGVNYLALQDLIIVYKGKPAHAASPQDGISALDGATLFKNGIDAFRQFIDDDVRLHGIIRKGGEAPNVIPEEAIIDYTVRANDTEKLKEVIKRVEDIARGAALMSNTQLTIEKAPIYDNAVVVTKLANLLLDNARLVGAKQITDPCSDEGGSTDFGNVSHRIPSECLDIAFVPVGTPGHTQDWVDAGISKDGHDSVLQASKAIALTAYDLITNSELLKEVKKEFKQIQQDGST